MTKAPWNHRIGEAFQLSGSPVYHLRWDLFPRVAVENREGNLKGLSAYRLGNLLYLGDRIFFAFGIDYKIQVYNEEEEWSQILKSVDDL
jgi:hypothetical protein